MGTMFLILNIKQIKNVAAATFNRFNYLLKYNWK